MVRCLQWEIRFQDWSVAPASRLDLATAALSIGDLSTGNTHILLWKMWVSPGIQVNEILMSSTQGYISSMLTSGRNSSVE